MKKLVFVLIGCLLSATLTVAGGRTYSGSITYNSYEGLLMAGYQGWFNAPGDGSGRGWYHYRGRDGFRPGSCTIDLWPDVSEYQKLYKTDFVYGDGTPAYLYSPRDYSTVDTHFRWMKEYGIDGVFMQRFVGEISSPSGLRNFNVVLSNAMKAANKYDRAICIMYDLSGMSPVKGPKTLLEDIDDLAGKHSLFDHKNNPSYLYHNGKPLVAVWGVGFNDNRKYGYDEAGTIIDGLKAKGFSIMIGVPSRWRERKVDASGDSRLHDLILKCDIVMPWFVGRYNEVDYTRFCPLIDKDLAWAKEHGVDYAPLAFPGFSWENMIYPRTGSTIPRNGGKFFRKQLDYLLDAGARMIYVAMFDEIDEGTAIYKLAKKLPEQQGGSRFVPLDEGLEPDLYLRLAGEAAMRLKSRSK